MKAKKQKTKTKTNACETCAWKNPSTCRTCSLYYKQGEREGADEK